MEFWLRPKKVTFGSYLTISQLVDSSINLEVARGRLIIYQFSGRLDLSQGSSGLIVYHQADKVLPCNITPNPARPPWSAGTLRPDEQLSDLPELAKEDFLTIPTSQPAGFFMAQQLVPVFPHSNHRYCPDSNKLDMGHPAGYFKNR